MAKALNLQEMFLNQARKEGIVVRLHLSEGTIVEGHVRGFDAFTILLEPEGKPTQLIYKHAVAIVVPEQAISGFKQTMKEFQDD